MSLDASGDQLTIVNEGAAKSHSLSLLHREPSAAAFFVGEPVLIGAHDAHHVLPQSWADLARSRVVVQVDQGNDGDVGSSLELLNRAVTLYAPLLVSGLAIKR